MSEKYSLSYRQRTFHGLGWIATLADETGREVHSEKMVEIHFRDGRPIAAGDQFGVGRVTQ